MFLILLDSLLGGGGGGGLGVAGCLFQLGNLSPTRSLSFIERCLELIGSERSPVVGVEFSDKVSVGQPSCRTFDSAPKQRQFFFLRERTRDNEKMQSVRKFIAGGHRIGVRCVSTADSASLRKSVVSLLDSLSLKPGATLVQNCGDSDIGKVVVQVAKERNLQTISIIEDKPGSPDIIEELKALGGDIVVPESYTKTWYMKRLAGELRPSAGLNFSDGYQATAVCKAVTSGGTFLTYGKKLPKHVAYDGAAHKPVEWDAFLKAKNLKVLNY